MTIFMGRRTFSFAEAHILWRKNQIKSVSSEQKSHRMNFLCCTFVDCLVIIKFLHSEYFKMFKIVNVIISTSNRGKQVIRSYVAFVTVGSVIDLRFRSFAALKLIRITAPVDSCNFSLSADHIYIYIFDFRSQCLRSRRSESD